MAKLQPLSAKLGEVNFRKKLVRQHQGGKISYPTHTSPLENLNLLKQRSQTTLRIFKDLKKAGLIIEPFLELGGEKCERATALKSKMNLPGVVIDISAESLKSAKQFCQQLGFKKLPLRICADAYRLPFADNCLPFIFTFQTLHHFPDPQPILAEVYRILAPGGSFYFDEEPIKQTFNFPLWRRDYHLVWWEKLLKTFLILPFISNIGKSEVGEGVLEESFTLTTWELGLNQFDQVKAELSPYPFGPRTKTTKGKNGWLKPTWLSKIIINLAGGGIKGWCRKKGKLKKVDQKTISQFLVCPDCGGKLTKRKNWCECLNHHQKFPIKNGVWYLLPEKLQQKLYPKIQINY